MPVYSAAVSEICCVFVHMPWLARTKNHWRMVSERLIIDKTQTWPLWWEPWVHNSYPQPILNLHNCAISFIVLPNLDDSTICDLFKLVNMGIKGIKCIQIWLEHTRARNQGPSKPIATTSAAKMPETLGAGRTPRAVIMRIFLSSRKMRRQTPCKSSQWDPMGCLLLWGYHTRIYSLKPISWICWKLRTNHWGWMRLRPASLFKWCHQDVTTWNVLASCNLSRKAEAKLAVKLLPLRNTMGFLVEGDELPLKGVKRPITNSTTRPSGHPLKNVL